MIKIKWLFFLSLGSLLMLTGSFALADPCRTDPFCHETDNADFAHPNHFVFVGTAPGDELPLYPLLKDHCSETDNYCALLFATHGESGCESGTAMECAQIRAAELRASAEYINADAWLYPLPPGDTIFPSTPAEIKRIYDGLARSAGYDGVMGYFKLAFRRLQPFSTRPLVVISPHPYPQTTPLDPTLLALDEFISRAIEDLQTEGMNILHIYADSKIKQAERAFVSRLDDWFLECRSGPENLIKTHKDLTQFDVFRHGTDDIYRSQLFRFRNFSNNPQRYQFCYDLTWRPFDTRRDEKLIGFMLTRPEHVEEVSTFSNAFSFLPRNIAEVTNYLNRNVNRLTPAIVINPFIFETKQHLVTDEHILALIEAIRSSHHQGPILFLLDEPLWHIRSGCLNGIESACHEITQNYTSTLTTLRKISRDLKKAFPQAGLMHIEAYMELLLQKTDRPSANVIMFDEAEYLGYDCYGAFNNCGPVDASATFADIQGSSISANFNEGDLVSFLSLYVIEDPEVKSKLIATGLPDPLPDYDRLGIVCSQLHVNCVGINLASVSSQSQSVYIQWILDTLFTMEQRKPMGRKMILVPGLMQDFNFFPHETQAMDQMNAFLEVLDSSSLFGAMGGFIWGDLQEGVFPYIGARSIASVRSLAAQAFRERFSSMHSTTSLPSSMSLVGGTGQRGNFGQVKLSGARQGDVYLQNAGMDTCSIRIGDTPEQIIPINQFNHIHIPLLDPPLHIKAKCSVGNQHFEETVVFID